MRITATLTLVGLLAFLTGCGSRPAAPLFSGKLEGGTFWQSPRSSATNSGSSYEKSSRVDVYDQFVVVTTPNGTSHVHPHGYYSDLAIRKD